MPVDPHPSFPGVEEADEQIHQRGLAGAGGPHDRDDLPRRGFQRDPPQYGSAGLVAEGHVVELNVTAERFRSRLG
jgi:hypothetical protein